jgi:histidinol-phosphate aminotransferase
MRPKDFMLKHLKNCAPVFYSGTTAVEPEVVLNLNEYQYPVSPKVIDTIKSQAANAAKYVYTGDEPTTDLIQAIARYNGVETKNVALDESLDQASNRMPRVFVDKGENVVTMTPSYPEIVYGTLRAGGSVKKVMLDMPGFSLNPEKILRAIDGKTKMVFLCNPNNPTSTKYPREDLLKIVENARAIVVVDECYFEYCRETLADVIDDYPNLIISRSFSKAFGLAGAKCAYLLGCEEIIDAFNRIMSGFEFNRFGVYAARAALDDLNYYKKVWDKIRYERDSLVEGLRRLGLKVWDSSSSFVFLDISATNKSSTEIRDLFLEKHKILVRDVSATFTDLDKRYVSFAVGTSGVNKKILGGFKDVLG